MMPDHGTRRRYGRGCRCTPCRDANAAYGRELRARAGLPDPKPVRARDLSAPPPQGRVAARLEDLEFLLDVGEYPDRAIARIGWSVAGAKRNLHRRGRHDLVARITERVAS
ncbi:hypothetical protein [Brachybacterium tyrofermentans]|uniref:hypothetical protein n=1 Tax=Brachybacterium tyrofermentans TaxID=47848 RepID=UPI00186950E2|nr:hypothetical protein [Brachybacterium tyrofermentans]